MCYNYVNTTITLFREKHDSVVVLCMTGSARHGTCHSCVEDYKLFELVHYCRLGSPIEEEDGVKLEGLKCEHGSGVIQMTPIG